MKQPGHHKSFVVGLNVPTSLSQCPDPVSYARRAEELGFDFVSASDHPCGADPTQETWTMLSWIAAGTSQLKVATRVLGVPYRSPAMVAKMGETLNRLSDGRLILGLGGGSADHEFRAFGLDVPSPREKIDGLEDAVRVIRGLWSEPQFTYEGRRHRVENADVEPKPSRQIPIWLGTFGKRSLAVTGRLADGWIPSLSYAPPDQIPAMREQINTAAQEAGRDPADIAFIYNVEVRVVGDLDVDGHVITGSPEVVTDRLRDLVRKLRMAGMNIMPIGPDLDEQVARLGTEVLPGLRETL
jgi:alkanesulfonate monooxygenase SsuD/methylene tetrahydromethanopterin reductase-like flavin-dependent oxidoreductase (luciferase family)